MGSVSNLNKNDIALVLGASGFVGRHLTQLLQERGLIVRVVSRRPYSEARLDNIKESHWLTGNFGDPEIIKVACQDLKAHISLVLPIAVGETLRREKGHASLRVERGPGMFNSEVVAQPRSDQLRRRHNRGPRECSR